MRDPQAIAPTAAVARAQRFEWTLLPKASQGDAIEADQRTGTQLEPAHAQEEEEAKRRPGHSQGTVSYTHLTLPTICSV